jgi:hypothetical protein
MLDEHQRDRVMSDFALQWASYAEFVGEALRRAKGSE